MPERRPKANMISSCRKQIHKPAWRQGTSIIQIAKKSDNFVWTQEADKALAQFKETLMKAQILASPKAEEPMMLYLTSTNRVISTAIIMERRKEGLEIPDQHPILSQ